MTPVFILQIWLLGLFALGILGAGAWLGHRWYQDAWAWDAASQASVFAPDLGMNAPTGMLLGAILLILWSLGGRFVVTSFLKRGCRTPAPGEKDPRKRPTPQSTATANRLDGSSIHVEFFGPADGEVVVLTHGWTLSGRAWNHLIRDLPDNFRLVTWDEPGMGRTSQPVNRDFSLENMAQDLSSVLKLCGAKPVVLIGHSIGGMILLTFAKARTAMLEHQVAGLVLSHTTPVNPVRTTSGASFLSAIEKPVLMPLMYLTIFLSPLVRVLSWLSYLNGSSHLSALHSSFAGTQTWQDLDFAATYPPLSAPAAQARGMLGMMRYSAESHLEQIDVPVLVVAGDLDGVTKPEASDMIVSGVPKARLHTLAPAKHLGLIEHHETYASVIREFAHMAHGQYNKERELAGKV
jgi:pimeloyl-ACP methyl ester carboxylesterase